MASFFRKFVDNFSSKASVLYCMLKRNQQQFIWTTECEESFCYIKNQLRNPNILVHPYFEKPFILRSDASNKAIGHALLQEVTGNFDQYYLLEGSYQTQSNDIVPLTRSY